MKCKAFVIAIFFSLIPLNEVYGFNKGKTADDYLDEAELIIENASYAPLFKNKNGEREKFTSLVNQSLELEETARALLFLGFVRHMVFDPDSYKDSVHYYEKALELKPNYLRALVALSSAHSNGRNYKECINSTNQVLKIDSQNIKAKELGEECQYYLTQQQKFPIKQNL